MLKRFPHLVVFLVAGGLYLAGLLAPLERVLMDFRFSLFQREATGDLVVVQIDARSLRELSVWPWPREFHANLIDRLFAAGVLEVALDVDLSASSTPDADSAFARVLEKHDGQVILPVFRQRAAPGTRNNELLDTTPLKALREYAQIGGVNMAVESDGLVRRALNSITIEGMIHPSMFTLLAGPAYLDIDTFLIDYSIDPLTIPRLSYVDVLRGTAALDRLAGKRVIIGASATELGDHLSVPIYRSLPGPILQVLAYESLVQNRAIRTNGAPVTLLIGVILALLLGPYVVSITWQRAALVTGVGALGMEAAALAVQVSVPFSLNTTPWLVIFALGFAQSVFRTVTVQDLLLFRQRMAMAYRRALMNRVVQDSFDGIVITDFQGNIEIFNRTAVEILGCGIQEVIGRPLQEVLPVAAGFMHQMATVPTTAGHEATADHSGPHECMIDQPDGTQIAIELVISRFLSRHSRDPRRRRTVERQNYTFTFRNITERKRVRDAERAAAEQALAASRTKSEFLANMSHELRTPLNAIIGFSDMIKSEVFGPVTPPQYLSYIQDINNSGQHLLEIINDILEVSKIDLGQIQLNEDTVDLKAMVEDSRRRMAGWPDSAKRTFETEIAPELPDLSADPRLIKQILINLLSNAVKYSEPGDRIMLRVFVAENGSPTIEIEDSGIGIEPSVIPYLTKPFYQVDGTLARMHEGTGLGLCLVSAYAVLHGATLRIESEPSVGTKVSVCFPPERALARQDASDTVEPQAGAA
ncbi:MAG TPA: CHASE2 domain-containing protein [Kiloniellales bacterium]